jgi:hypothetical protein
VDQPSPDNPSDLEAPPRPSAPPDSSSAVAGRWELSISVPTLAVLTAVAVVLLLVAFSAGRHYEARYPSTTETAQSVPEQGEAAPPDQVAVSEGSADVSQADQPTATVPQPPRQASAHERAAPQPTREQAPRVTLKKGCHYVVVQHFPKKSGHQPAQDAARYLQTNGIECATLTGADIRLVVTEPFLINQEDAAAARRQQQRAETLMQRIRGLGRQYNRKLATEGKPGYTFAECSLRPF